MKKAGLFSFASIGFIFFLISSCTKINEATTVGSDLIPAVDNVNTFETSLEVDTSNYYLSNDSTKLFYTDQVALGKFNDPVFGSTTANVYFNLSAPAYGAYPFVNRDSVFIDSVVLSLSYKGGYGDLESVQSVKVFDIAPLPTTNFRADTSYRFNHQPEFDLGLELGSATFKINSLKDSVQWIRKRDTARYANELHIRLDTNWARRFVSYDTTSSSNGGYKNDSIFHTLFRGLAVKAETFTGNGGLAYFSLTDREKTDMTIYFRVRKNGVNDTLFASFQHLTNGQANLITRQNGGDYAAYLPAGASPDGKLYIQSTPGSYANVKVNGLDTFKNKVIHRAELIVSKIPSVSDDIFTAPERLFLEKMNPQRDIANVFENDLQLGLDGSIGFASFGGNLRSDNTFRFNLTRHVQGIITRDEPNALMRLYAPLRAPVYLNGRSQLANLPVNSQVAKGRVVIGGGKYINPAQRMRLRIIYSNL